MSATDSEEHPQTPALRVQDALGYLEQVKSKFLDLPVVYSQFLDIMKEFKSQTLDTPGVIKKVSTLFEGHTDLIVGFNTFLPPDYRIEQLAHNNEIRITTLSGQHHDIPSHQQIFSTTTPAPNTIIQPTNQTLQQTQQVAPVSSADFVQSNTFTSPPQVLPTNIQQPQKHLSQTINKKNSSDFTNYNQTLDTGQLDKTSPIPLAPQIVGSQCVVTQNSNSKQTQPSIKPGSEFGFNHALNYVNKIKHRFSANPEIYQQFLEILHTYQRDQHATKVSGSKIHLENEVYSQVARLFQNQKDLLEEFSQFLPDANGTASSGGNINSLTRVHQMSPNYLHQSNVRRISDGNVRLVEEGTTGKRQNARGNHLTKASLKRQNAIENVDYPPFKRPKMTSLRDVSLAEAGKHGSLNEYAFFDKVRKSVGSHDVYENFLKCLVLYNHEVISRVDLLHLVTRFLGRFPDLYQWFKEFLGFKDGITSLSQIPNSFSESMSVDGIFNTNRKVSDRMSDETSDIDYSSCKRYGASYRGLPKSFSQPKCSGRTQLCKEVLNDTLVSFPSWSEDSTFVSSRKTQFEEYIYRCEDERFELDIVIESNLLTVRVLEAVKRKIERMSSDEKNRFKLDDNLGGTSCTIHQRSIRRIYGDKASEIVDGLKKNSLVAVPLVLKRLKAKDEEWREAQRHFNKIWREQNEKYYLKSLDHQGLTFKQNDIKYLRGKSLIKEIEDLHKETRDEDLTQPSVAGGGIVIIPEVNGVPGVPQIVFVYKDRDILEEACNLIIHHVKRQTSIHKDDKQKIKQLMRQFLPDLFFAPRGELSDDELDENEEQNDIDAESEKCFESNNDIKQVSNKSSNKIDSSFGPKHSSRFNRTSPKLSCDESPLKDPELGEPIRPEHQKYLSDIDTSQKNDVIPLKLETQDTPQKLVPLAIVTEANLNKEANHNLSRMSEALLTRSPQNLQSKHHDDSYHLFYVDDKWYCFLRLHHILCQRLASIYERSKIIIAEEEKERKDRKDSSAMALRLKPRNDIEVEDYFPVFVDMIKQLLDGNLDSNQYEDMLRDMFGIYAYVAFTMDKVVQNIVRQLQHIVSDESSIQCTELFTKNSKIVGTVPLGTTNQSRGINYLKKIEQVLEEENRYKVTIYKNEFKMAIECLESENPDSSDNEDSEEKWSNYMNKELSREHHEKKSRLGKRLFLARNVRRYMVREKKAEQVCPKSLNDKNSQKKLQDALHQNDKNSKGQSNHSGINKQEEFSPEHCNRMLIFDSSVHISFYRRNRSRVSHQKWRDVKKKKFDLWSKKWIEKNALPKQVSHYD